MNDRQDAINVITPKENQRGKEFIELYSPVVAKVEIKINDAINEIF